MFDLHLQSTVSPAFSLDVSLQSSALCLGLTGPSGSGKSTVLEAIAGLRMFPESRIVINGRTLDPLTPAARRTGLLMQAPHLFPHLNVSQNLIFGQDRATRPFGLDEIVDWLDIRPLLNRSVRYLSGGERQRVGLGRALLSGPDILLLDEPFSALDVERRQHTVQGLKERLTRAQLPCLIVTHEQTILDGLCEDVRQMQRGRVTV